MKEIFKKDKKLSVDQFFERVLYDNKMLLLKKKNSHTESLLYHDLFKRVDI